MIFLKKTQCSLAQVLSRQIQHQIDSLSRCKNSIFFSMLASLAFFVALLPTGGSLCADETYDFYGRHFLAQYYDCDRSAMNDTQQLASAMKEAALASGAQILSFKDYVFDGSGYTMVILLSESHASIHTYPEYGACFVDLFTCGQRCSAEKFDAVLRKYLKPKRVDSQIKIRN